VSVNPRTGLRFRLCDEHRSRERRWSAAYYDRARRLAAKDGEDEQEEDTRLQAVVELYRSDPMAMADSLWRMREEVGALRTRLEQLEQRPE